VDRAAGDPAAQDPNGTPEPRAADAALVLRYRVIGRSTPQASTPEEVVAAPTDFEHEVTVGLEADGFYVEGPDGRRIYDRAARRILALTADRRTYTEESFFWTPDFLTAQFVDRIGAASLMGQVGVADPAFSPFHMEALFRAQIPGQAVEVVPRPKGDDGFVEFVSGGESVAGWQPSDIAVPESLRPSFTCFLSRKARLHPAIQGVVVASGTAPGVLEFRNYNVGVRLDARWELEAAERGQRPDGGWLVHAGVEAVRDLSSLEPLQHRLYFARGDLLPRPGGATRPDPSDLVRRARSAAARGDGLDAFLMVMEASLQSGDRPALGPADLFGARGADPRTQGFLQAMERSQGETAAGAAAWFQSFDRAGLTRPHMVDVFLASALRAAGDLPGAEAALLSALGANPWLAAAYKDLGDVYRRRMDMLRAWQCYDAGRALAPGHEIFAPVESLQRELLRDRATFF